MIKARFLKSQGKFVGFSINGHAGYAEHGKDIACASVTSAVQLTANAITELLQVKAKLDINENEIMLKLPQSQCGQSEVFLKALWLHLNLLAEDFEGTIKVTILEVH